MEKCFTNYFIKKKYEDSLRQQLLARVREIFGPWTTLGQLTANPGSTSYYATISTGDRRRLYATVRYPDSYVHAADRLTIERVVEMASRAVASTSWHELSREHSKSTFTPLMPAVKVRLDRGRACKVTYLGDDEEV